MATIAIVLKTKQKLSNNEYAVALRVTHERQSRFFVLSSLVTNHSLQWRCKIEDWKPAEIEDNGFGRFRKTFLPYKECNEILKTKLTEAQRILKRYDEDNMMFSFDQFEAELKHKEYKPSIVKEEPAISVTIQEYYSQQIAVLDEQGRVGLSGLLFEVQRILKKFRPNALITDVNFRFLESFEYWMRNERGNKDTTISVKMRNLQRVINQAIEDKLFKQEDYPFGEKKYSINKRLDNKTKKIAITLDKIGKLKALVLEPGSAMFLAQQMFLFSYYSRGMNFIDMAYLKWDNISDSTITYVRKKTGASFEIPLHGYNLPILQYYKERHTIKGGFIFPIIDPTIHITLKQQYVDLPVDLLTRHKGKYTLN